MDLRMFYRSAGVKWRLASDVHRVKISSKASRCDESLSPQAFRITSALKGVSSTSALMESVGKSENRAHDASPKHRISIHKKARETEQFKSVQNLEMDPCPMESL
eukprot:scaffold71_cov247-Pinguiococcus_pyrenoidosus.AAC.24